MKRLAIVALVIAALCGGCGQSRPIRAGSSPSSTPTPSESSQASEKKENDYVGFYPKSRVDGDKVVMPLTFLDGSSAEAVAATGLGIQDMSATIYTSGGLGVVDRTMDFRYWMVRHSCIRAPWKPMRVRTGRRLNCGTQSQTWLLDARTLCFGSISGSWA